MLVFLHGLIVIVVVTIYSVDSRHCVYIQYYDYNILFFTEIKHSSPLMSQC